MKGGRYLGRLRAAQGASGRSGEFYTEPGVACPPLKPPSLSVILRAHLNPRTGVTLSAHFPPPKQATVGGLTVGASLLYFGDFGAGTLEERKGSQSAPLAWPAPRGRSQESARPPRKLRSAPKRSHRSTSGDTPTLERR